MFPSIEGARATAPQTRRFLADAATSRVALTPRRFDARASSHFLCDVARQVREGTTRILGRQEARTAGTARDSLGRCHLDSSHGSPASSAARLSFRIRHPAKATVRTAQNAACRRISSCFRAQPRTSPRLPCSAIANACRWSRGVQALDIPAARYRRTALGCAERMNRIMKSIRSICCARAPTHQGIYRKRRNSRWVYNKTQPACGKVRSAATLRSAPADRGRSSTGRRSATCSRSKQFCRRAKSSTRDRRQ